MGRFAAATAPITTGIAIMPAHALARKKCKKVEKKRRDKNVAAF
jgi:hypothetical protein